MKPSSDDLTISITFDGQDSEPRIDKYLASLDQINSRNKALQLIKLGLVLVDSKPVKASYKLQAGDQICITLPKTEPSSALIPLDLELNVAYEDSDVIVINKPAGLVVHPAVGHENDTLVNALIHHCKDLAMGFNENRPGIVHRIDKGTSGLLVVAKNDVAHEHLSLQFKNKTIHRIYNAIVFGQPKFSNKTITTHLRRHPHLRKKYASEDILPGALPKGKLATTHVRVLKNYSNGLSLIECQLETGRTHQIRVHLSEAGYPIVGDDTYGGKSRAKGLKGVHLRKLIKEMPRFALHACELGFVHPKTNKTLSFKAPFPSDLENLKTDS